jgi:hypothetical protein
MASYANLIADQGADFETSVTLEDERSDPINLSGYTLAGQIRRTYKSATSYDFEVNITSASDGIISISLPATVSAVMRSGRYVYDIYASNSTINKSYKVLEGILELVPSVTRVEAEEAP